jgi:hypothetical protein
VRAALAVRLRQHDAFARALEDLHQPELRLSDWLSLVHQASVAHKIRVTRAQLQEKALAAAGEAQEAPGNPSQREASKRKELERNLPLHTQRALFDALTAQFLGNRDVHNNKLRSAGSINTTFWNKWIDALHAHFKSGANVTQKAVELWRASKFGDAENEASRSPKRIDKLSAWLADFSINSSCGGADDEIEIPGQYDRYDGRTAPPAYMFRAGESSMEASSRLLSLSPAAAATAALAAPHATLACVDPSLLTLQSKMRPKRIVFVGRDERAYAFLVKGGEDIRVDQRVEQMFRGANVAFDADASASARSMRLRTYSAIPVTPLIGLLEWVPKAVPLKMLIEHEAFSRMSAVAQAAALKFAPSRWTLNNSHAGQERKRWMETFVPAVTSGQVARQAAAAATAATGITGAAGARRTVQPQAAVASYEEYRECFRRAGGEAAEQAWERVMQHQPVDLLRTGLLRLAPSPEGFLAVRQSFLRSYAAVCAAGYVVGIGDRHLDNFLLSKADASVVAIDFGVCFGAGASSLSVPELLPFRLTPAIAAAAAPLPSTRLLHSHLTVCLRAMQAEGGRRALLAIMDTFVREPTLDWRITAQRKEAQARGALEGLGQSSTGARGLLHASPADAGPPDATMCRDGSSGQIGSLALGAGTVEDDTVDGGSWYPRAKVLIASLKLRRANPGPLMMLELLQNPHCLPSRAVIVHPRTRALVQGLKHVVLGSEFRRAEHPRCAPQNAVALRITRFERLLLEAAVGGPLAGGDATLPTDAAKLLELRLTACHDVAAQAACLLDLAGDPNVLVRQYAGLATWV